MLIYKDGITMSETNMINNVDSMRDNVFHPCNVLVRIDNAGRVVEINSDAFLESTDGWTQIDSGYGDRYHHAQGNYLPGPLYDKRGVCRYKLVGGAAVERTQDEMDADWAAQAHKETPTQLDRIEAQVLYTALMNDTILEEVEV